MIASEEQIDNSIIMISKRQGGTLTASPKAPSRSLYHRAYPENLKWSGYLSEAGKKALEKAGNRVLIHGGHYILNPTGQLDLGAFR